MEGGVYSMLKKVVNYQMKVTKWHPIQLDYEWERGTWEQLFVNNLRVYIGPHNIAL